MNINRNQAPGRNGPEGAEVDRSQRQKPTCVLVLAYGLFSKLCFSLHRIRS